MAAAHRRDVLLEATEGWDDPEKSCGRDFHLSPWGDHFFAVIGPAAAAWSQLSQDLTTVVEALDRKETDALLSLHMAMIGPSRKASSPRILLCSKDGRVQRAVYNAIISRGLMREHPSIGIDACSNPPIPLTAGAIPEYTLPLQPREDGVWAAKVPRQFGRQLFIRRPEGGPPQIATGGVTFFLGQEAYQTTAIHNFPNQEKAHLQTSHAAFSDLDMEDSDVEEEADDGSLTGDGQTPGQPPSAIVSLMHTPSASGQEQLNWKGKDPELPRDCSRIGTIVSTGSDLDYALVKLDDVGGRDSNRVLYGPPGNRKQVWAGNCGRIGEERASDRIVIVTSSASIPGILSLAACLIKPQGQTKCQKLYPVKVEDRQGLRPGDSGSGVVDTNTGEILGHVISGHRGTHIAYILPMETVIRDIGRVFNHDGSLALTTEPPRIRQPFGREVKDFIRHPIKYMSRSTRKELSTVEFSSPRFYRDEIGEDKPKRRLVKGTRRVVMNKLAHMRLPEMGKAHVQLATAAETTKRRLPQLPPEIRDMISKQLPPRDAWTLRQVSREWRASVLINADAISQLFIRNRPLPPLARKIYDARIPGLVAIEWVRHGHDMAHRLAVHMSRWMGREIFDLRTHEQQRIFNTTKRRMIQRRLIPPLFAVFHFLEKYPSSLLGHLRQPASASTSTPSEAQEPLQLSASDVVNPNFNFESAIMSLYSDELLVQAHQAFQILVKYIGYLLNGPSYPSSAENVARRRPTRTHRYLLDKKVQAAILGIGGLDAVVRFGEISKLEDRRAEVRKFFAALYNEQSLKEYSDLTKHLPFGDVAQLLQNLPPLDDVWQHTAKDILVQRNVFGHRWNVPKYAQALTELIRPGETEADGLYEGHELWHSLVDCDFGNGKEAEQ